MLILRNVLRTIPSYIGHKNETSMYLILIINLISDCVTYVYISFI